MQKNLNLAPPPQDTVHGCHDCHSFQILSLSYLSVVEAMDSTVLVKLFGFLPKFNRLQSHGSVSCETPAI